MYCTANVAEKEVTAGRKVGVDGEQCCRFGYLVWFALLYSLVWLDLVWFGLVWLGLAWFVLVWFGLVWFGCTGFALPCPALPCPALPYLALPCLAFRTRGGGNERTNERTNERIDDMDDMDDIRLALTLTHLIASNFGAHDTGCSWLWLWLWLWLWCDAAETKDEINFLILKKKTWRFGSII